MKVLYRVDVICKNYDPEYYSSTHLVVGFYGDDGEAEVYDHFWNQYIKGNNHDRELKVESLLFSEDLDNKSYYVELKER